jgi:hypothetical protein
VTAKEVQRVVIEISLDQQENNVIQTVKTVVVVVVDVVVVVVIIIIIIIIAMFSQIFPGTFPLEPMVNPTTQASSF